MPRSRARAQGGVDHVGVGGAGRPDPAGLAALLGGDHLHEGGGSAESRRRGPGLSHPSSCPPARQEPPSKRSGRNAPASWKLFPDGGDQAANTASFAGSRGPPGRLMRKTLNRHAVPRLRGGTATPSAEGSALQALPREEGGRGPAGGRPCLVAAGVHPGLEPLEVEFDVPLLVRPGGDHPQVAHDVGRVDLQLVVVVPGPVQVDEDLDDLLFPDVLVPRRSWCATGRGRWRPSAGAGRRRPRGRGRWSRSGPAPTGWGRPPPTGPPRRPGGPRPGRRCAPPRTPCPTPPPPGARSATRRGRGRAAPVTTRAPGAARRCPGRPSSGWSPRGRPRRSSTAPAAGPGPARSRSTRPRSRGSGSRSRRARP